jgi:hypothetical protein
MGGKQHHGRTQQLLDRLRTCHEAATARVASPREQFATAEGFAERATPGPPTPALMQTMAEERDRRPCSDGVSEVA